MCDAQNKDIVFYFQYNSRFDGMIYQTTINSFFFQVPKGIKRLTFLTVQYCVAVVLFHCDVGEIQ